jgi:hypothetical protein
MNLLLITYDLKKPGQDYSSLYQVIQSAPYWWHYLESTWIISSRDTPNDWFNKLKPTIDENDNLLIVDISKRPRQGWLSQKAWDWLKTHDV